MRLLAYMVFAGMFAGAGADAAVEARQETSGATADSTLPGRSAAVEERASDALASSGTQKKTVQPADQVSLPAATGIQLAKPDLNVVVAGGAVGVIRPGAGGALRDTESG